MVTVQGSGLAADGADVLLQVLTRSGLLTVQTAATGPVDAMVLVTADGPEGGGTVADLAASVWESYVPATVVVVFDATPSPSVATEAMAHGETLATTNRPSVVIATHEVLAAPQVVLALVEQRDGRLRLRTATAEESATDCVTLTGEPTPERR